MENLVYQALYRVWRSQRFDDVIGQEAITQTLKNAITQSQIPMLIYLQDHEAREKLVLQKFLLKPSIVLIVSMVNLVMNVKFVVQLQTVLKKM